MQFTTVIFDMNQLTSAYGAGATGVLDQMSFQISRITGEEPTDWAFRAYDNGLLVPVPAVINDAVLPEMRLRECFLKAITRTAEALHLAFSGRELPEEIVSACERAEALCKLASVN